MSAVEQLKGKTDEELVGLCESGDDGAMDELLCRHSGLVRSCARRYFLIGGETEDLIQEGMIGLYHAINGYDGKLKRGMSFKNFAYLCISRRIMDAVKRASRKKNLAEGYGLVDLETDVATSGLNPEELLILNDEQRELKQKMSRVLSDFEFKITTMYVEGMSCAEICEATGKPAKSVDNALQRSKRKLLQILKK